VNFIEITKNLTISHGTSSSLNYKKWFCDWVREPSYWNWTFATLWNWPL